MHAYTSYNQNETFYKDVWLVLHQFNRMDTHIHALFVTFSVVTCFKSLQHAYWPL